jgi:hypothetical protein
MNYVNKRNDSEIQLIRDIAESNSDGPVMMMNLNYYSAEASFPNGEIYKSYMSVLEKFLPVVGAKILWRHPVFGQVTGEQPLHEILAAWYPTHQAFLDLPNAPGAEENFRLRALAVERAVIHRVTGGAYPFSPA